MTKAIGICKCQTRFLTKLIDRSPQPSLPWFLTQINQIKKRSSAIVFATE